MSRHLVFALNLLVIIACTEQKALVTLIVQVRTNQGDPVSGAQIDLDGKSVGVSDQTGRLSYQVELPAASTPRLEVRKESDTYYFAPYVETFTIGDSPTASFDVEATLYFVPKPQPQLTVQEDSQRSDPLSEEEPSTELELTAEKSVTEGDSLAKPKNATERTDTQPNDLVVKRETPVSSGLKLEDQASLPNAGEESDSPVSKSEQTVAATNRFEAPRIDQSTGVLQSRSDRPLSDLASMMPPPVNLSPIGTVIEGTNNYPKPAKAKVEQVKDPLLFTIHVYSGDKPLPDTDVFLGHQTNGDLKTVCKTNRRGRCVVTFDQKPAEPVSFVVQKIGFKTVSQTTRVTPKGRLRFSLKPGKTIDLFAVTEAFNFTKGLSDVEVIIDGRRVGKTDQFGRYSHVYTGKVDDLVSVALRAPDYRPSIFETDFVASGAMNLVKHFTPKDPPPVRTVLLKLRSAGRFEVASQSRSDTSHLKLDRYISSATRQHLFSSAAFKEQPLAFLKREMKRNLLSIDRLVRQGWSTSDLKASIDAVLLPTVVMADRPELQLAMIDSKGQTLAAAKERLRNLSDENSIDQAVADLTKKIIEIFPFEGAVLGKSGEQVKINLGFNSGRGVKIGDQLSVDGVQSSPDGCSQLHGDIAMIEVVEVSDGYSMAKVIKLAPRSIIGQGDLVRLQKRAFNKAGPLATIRVFNNKAGRQPIDQANVYTSGVWLGATDVNGRLTLPSSVSGELRIIKHGYRTAVGKLTQGGNLQVGLDRESALVRLETIPTGAEVRIDGKSMGKSPFDQPVPVPTGFVKLEIIGTKGYKPYTSVLELDEGTIDLTGARAINLERDLLGRGEQLVAQGNIKAAIVALEKVKPEHSDYLPSRHKIGELYLSVLNRPADAAAAFNEVTKTEEVSQFIDKRFIGSHINEGIALYLTAERLMDKDKAAAAAHLKTAIEVLSGVATQLRFVPPEQYAQAVHNVDFHTALAKHRLWNITGEPTLLADVLDSWQTYLTGNAKVVPTQENTKAYIDHAAVYMRQAEASRKAQGSVAF